MMYRKQIKMLFSVTFILAISCLNVQGQGKNVELKDKRISIQMDCKPLLDVFIQLIYEYDVAIGFEESTLDKNHDDYDFQTNIPYNETNITNSKGGAARGLSGLRPVVKNHLISLNFTDARLGDVLNAVVKQMKNYSWDINDDVINIFPIKGRDTRFEKLLNLKVRGFVVPKDKEVGIIQPMIVLNLPEFKAFLAENNLFAESDRTAPWYIERPLPMELRFSDLSFKQLLNRITKSKRGGWILKTNKLNKPENKGKEVIEILI
jgi:hypothetical protein